MAAWRGSGAPDLLVVGGSLGELTVLAKRERRNWRMLWVQAGVSRRVGCIRRGGIAASRTLVTGCGVGSGARWFGGSPYRIRASVAGSLFEGGIGVVDSEPPCAGPGRRCDADEPCHRPCSIGVPSVDRRRSRPASRNQLETCCDLRATAPGPVDVSGADPRPRRGIPLTAARPDILGRDDATELWSWS